MATARAAKPKATRKPAAKKAKPAAKKAKPAAKKAPPPANPPRESRPPPKPRTPAILAVVDQVRALCLALPDTTEVVAWGESTWRVAGKVFAMFDTFHHGNPHLS